MHLFTPIICQAPVIENLFRKLTNVVSKKRNNGVLEGRSNLFSGRQAYSMIRLGSHLLYSVLLYSIVCLLLQFTENRLNTLSTPLIILINSRIRLENYEQWCAVDAVTQGCAGSPASCRAAVVAVLGTQLRAACACRGTDFAQLYDCLGWQRLLWLNPCVGAWYY